MKLKESYDAMGSFNFIKSQLIISIWSKCWLKEQDTTPLWIKKYE